MITNAGKMHIKRYLAGFAPSIAQSIAFGIGGKAEAATDTRLQFEAGRVPIKLTSFDFINNRLVWKAQLPDTFSGTIYEAAIYSIPADSVAGSFNSRTIISFDSSTENWIDSSTTAAATFATGNSRIGINSLRHTPAVNQTTTSVLSELNMDLGGYSGADKFVLVYYVGNNNTTDLKFRFLTDASNYYEISLGPQTTGYKFTEIAKSAVGVTGSPNWASITEIRVSTSTNGVAASLVDFDGIRVEDMDTVNPDYIMIARELLDTPFTKDQGKIQEIEFTMDVTI